MGLVALLKSNGKKAMCANRASCKSVGDRRGGGGGGGGGGAGGGSVGAGGGVGSKTARRRSRRGSTVVTVSAAWFSGSQVWTGHGSCHCLSLPPVTALNRIAAARSSTAMLNAHIGRVKGFLFVIIMVVFYISFYSVSTLLWKLGEPT